MKQLPTLLAAIAAMVFVVFIEWIWLYFTGTRGARLITGDDRIPRVIKPPPDFRARGA